MTTDRALPRIVYSWFSISYHWWSKIGFVGWVLVFFHICCCRFISVAMSQAILYWAPLMVFYATYFGILIRDCAEACTDFVSNTLGVRISCHCGLSVLVFLWPIVVVFDIFSAFLSATFCFYCFLLLIVAVGNISFTMCC